MTSSEPHLPGVPILSSCSPFAQSLVAWDQQNTGGGDIVWYQMLGYRKHGASILLSGTAQSGVSELPCPKDTQAAYWAASSQQLAPTS